MDQSPLQLENRVTVGTGVFAELTGRARVALWVAGAVILVWVFVAAFAGLSAR